jgi:hypothetical protein
MESAPVEPRSDNGLSLNVLKNWSEIRFRFLDIAFAAWRICSHIRIVVTQLVKKDTDHRKGTWDTIQYYTYTQINRYRFCSMNDLFSYSYRGYPVSKKGNRCKSTWETIQLYTYTQIKIKEQLLERKDMDQNEHAGFIHFFVEQNQGLFKDFPGQKIQFSSTFFWAFSYIKPCLTLPFFKWKCLYPVRKMMDVQCQW